MRVAAPGILRQFTLLRDQPRPHWIQVHILAHHPQIHVVRSIHQQRLVLPREQMPSHPVSRIESLRGGSQKPLQSSHQRGLGSLQNQVKMISHEEICMHLPTAPPASLPERPLKSPPILLIEKNYLPDPLDSHMTNSSRILDSWWPFHQSNLSDFVKSVITRD